MITGKSKLVLVVALIILGLVWVSLAWDAFNSDADLTTGRWMLETGLSTNGLATYNNITEHTTGSIASHGGGVFLVIALIFIGLTVSWVVVLR